MRTKLLTLLLTALATIAGAASVTLEWNPSPDAGIAFYRLDWGVNGRWTGSKTVGNVAQVRIDNLPTGLVRFQCSARDPSGQWSEPSNWCEVNVTNGAKAIKMRLTIEP